MWIQQKKTMPKWRKIAAINFIKMLRVNFVIYIVGQKAITCI